MKANEFVKKFGLGKAKEVSSFTSNVCADPTHFDSDLDIYVHFDDFKGVMDESDVCIADLKRLVDSHELVRSYKGCGKPRETALATAKFTLRHLKSTRKLEIELFGSNNRELELERAIVDVESCK